MQFGFLTVPFVKDSFTLCIVTLLYPPTLLSQTGFSPVFRHTVQICSNFNTKLQNQCQTGSYWTPVSYIATDLQQLLSIHLQLFSYLLYS